MPSIAYDASRRALFQPEARASLFRAGFDAGDALQIALECARLAYYRFDEGADEVERLTQALGLAGFGAPRLFMHAGSDGQGFAAVHAAGLGVLAFRGTQPDRIGDLATDAHVLLRPWELGGGAGRVHAGFRNTALGLWPDVKLWLDATRPDRLIVCGHSLGAAIATLLALPAGAHQLVTIGSPRVGDAQFVAQIAASGLDHLRIVDCCDVVTEIPPEVLGFRHLEGPVLYIDRTGQRLSAPAQDVIDEDRRRGRLDYLAQHAFRFGTVLTRDLADHAPINYLRAFWP